MLSILSNRLDRCGHMYFEGYKYWKCPYTGLLGIGRQYNSSLSLEVEVKEERDWGCLRERERERREWQWRVVNKRAM